MPTFLPRQLEGVASFLTQEAGTAREHAQRLDRPGCFDLPHIHRLPSELIEDAADDPRCRVVVQADYLTGAFNEDWRPDWRPAQFVCRASGWLQCFLNLGYKAETRIPTYYCHLDLICFAKYREAAAHASP